MEHLLVSVRLFLAIVLTVAGTAKLADLAGARRAFVAFGGPASLAPTAAWLLPIGEFATALALLAGAAATAGAVAALTLFTIFTIAIGIAVARRSAVDCHCFGQMSVSPVSWGTLLRTFVLACLAGVAVYGGVAGASPGIARALPALPASDLAASAVLLGVVGAITWAVAWAGESRRRELALVERVDALERRLAASPATPAEAPKAQAPDEGLPVGAAAPARAAAGSSGRPALILFVSSSCPPCKALSPEIATWREQLGEAAEITIVNRDEGDGKALAEAFRAQWTPAAVLLGGTGRIASSLRYGSDGVRGLVALLRESVANGIVDDRTLYRRLGSRVGDTSLVVGDPAPALELVDANGARRSGGGFGEETLLLFWDPDCGYCQAMAEEFRAIEATPAAGQPNVVFVVARSADVARGAQAVFSSPSYFDPGSTVAPLFGARGTPTAVLVDRDGRIASTVAVGKEPILSLLVPAAGAGRAADSVSDGHVIGMR